MQYDNYAFSSNGKQTMVARSGQELISVGYRKDEKILSEYDIKAIKTFYQCDSNQDRDEINVTETTTVTTATSTASGSYTFIINNKRTFPVYLYWINYQGQQVYYTVVKPGASYTQQTYLTHKWLLTSGDNRYNKQFEIGKDSEFKNKLSVFNLQ
jgi:hypothetical protein